MRDLLQRSEQLFYRPWIHNMLEKTSCEYKTRGQTCRRFDRYPSTHEEDCGTWVGGQRLGFPPFLRIRFASERYHCESILSPPVSDLNQGLYTLASCAASSRTCRILFSTVPETKEF